MDTPNYDIPAELLKAHEENIIAYNQALERVMNTTALIGGYAMRKAIVEQYKAMAAEVEATKHEVGH